MRIDVYMTKPYKTIIIFYLTTGDPMKTSCIVCFCKDNGED